MAKSEALRGGKTSAPEFWLALATMAVALLCALPFFTIIYLAMRPQENIWPHLASTVLPGYVWRTLLLLLGVGALTSVIGTTTAWLVTMREFPFRRVFRWACLMPLATPTYIISYTYVDFFNYAGPLQTSLRQLMGWKTPQDYVFPEIRSLGGAILVMSFVLYPYVFMTAQASFLRQPASQLDVARTLGKSAWGAFLSVALPQARPAIAVGISLALMECLNDIAAVNFFGVRTLTLGIYTTWLGEGNLGGAAQLSAVLLVFVLALLWIERHGQRQQPLYPHVRENLAFRRTTLHGGQAVLAILTCLLPVFLGFILPVFILLRFALRRISATFSPEFFVAAGHSLILAVIASVIVVGLGLSLAYANRLRHLGLVRFFNRIASMGYAIPGTILGIGVLIPLAGFDNRLDAFLRSSFGISSGPLLSGTIAAILFAYAIRFLAIAVGSLEHGLERVTTNISAASRALGRSSLQTFIEIHLPMLRPALVSAALLVFVDCMKELPATLILRPFDFDTLSTLVFSLASLDQLEASAAPALTIVAAGILPVIFLARNLRGFELWKVPE